MSGQAERITWGDCPRCGDRIAIGWSGDGVAEIDCVNACELGAGPAGLRTCCQAGLDVYPDACPAHGPQVPDDLLETVDAERESAR
jgi:hypothetical protein